MFYPSNVSPFNTFRFLTAESVDTGDDTILSIRMPKQFVYYFMGALSLLMEVNEWEQYGALTPEDMVNIAVNEVEFVDFCAMVANCIETDTDVQEALAFAISNNADVQNVINNVTHNLLIGNSGTQAETPDFDDLDYVWGGLLNAIEEFDNAVNSFALVANSAATAEEWLLNGLVPKYLTQAVVDKVASAFTLGITAIISFFEDPDSRNDFMCAIFDVICSRGVPYILKPEDIQAGWDELNVLSSFGIPGITDMVKVFFSIDKFVQIFQIGSDEPDNDWTILCSCSPQWEAIIDLTTNNVLSINGTFGQWVNGVGYQAIANFTGGTNRTIIEASLTTDPFTLRSYEFTVTEVPVSPNNAASQTRYGVSSAARINTQFDVINAVDRVLDVDISPQFENNTFLSIQRLPAQPSNGSASSTVTELRVVGIGDIPSQLAPYIV